MGRALVELLTANFTPEMSNWDAAVLGENIGQIFGQSADLLPVELLPT